MLYLCPSRFTLLLMYSAVNDAVRMRLESGVFRESDVSKEVLHSDTMDQYRTFQMCERLLHCPSKLANQLLFQIPSQRQAVLVERYCLRCLSRAVYYNLQNTNTVYIYMFMIFMSADSGGMCWFILCLGMFVGIMSLTIRLPERFWERSFLKGPRRT